MLHTSPPAPLLRSRKNLQAWWRWVVVKGGNQPSALLCGGNTLSSPVVQNQAYDDEVCCRSSSHSVRATGSCQKTDNRMQLQYLLGNIVVPAGYIWLHYGNLLDTLAGDTLAA